MTTISSAFTDAAALYLGDTRLETQRLQWLDQGGHDDIVRRLLAYWSQLDSRPTILFLDEVDALVGDTLISLLRQIRAGYAQRPNAFPQTVVLCGVRDIRDYRIHTPHQEIITGGGAFNIKAESLRLGNFTREETIALWKQHTQDCGQIFDDAIWNELWEDTRGQPWLVNALGAECVWEDKTARNRSTPITLERYKQARERLIYSRATHLDALTDKLREPRVCNVISTMLSGEVSTAHFPDDDLQYIEDLGLIQRKPELRISNRIYREVLPREITSPIQDFLHYPQPWFLTPQRKLDMEKLLSAFQQFFREHSDAWMDGFTFKEAGPQLLMQAFLQRIINGGGRISREYGLGLKRTDLLIEWPIDEEKGFLGPVQRIVIELKLLKQGKSLAAVEKEGLPQTANYAQQCGVDEAHLVIFDRRPKISWEKRIWRKNKPSGITTIPTIAVWGA